MDHARAQRDRARAERHLSALAAPRDDEGKRKNLARKRALSRARRVAAGLPTPLVCAVRTSGHGELDAAGVVGWREARRAIRWGEILGSALFSLPAIAAWAAAATGAEVGVVEGIVLVGLTLLVVVPPAQALWRTWRRATAPAPATLEVRWGASEQKGVAIAWEDGRTLHLPIEKIERTEMWLGEVRLPQGAPRDRGETASVEIVGGEGARVRVGTTRAAAQKLEAAIHVARADRSEARSSSKKVPRKKREAEIVTPPPPLEPALPPPNEAALSALDRGGRSLEAWSDALHAVFANVGYRQSPPLPPEELLQVVTDLRISAERRIGAALALSLRGDQELRARLRIASGEMETPALRIAVERVADGCFGDDGLEEALSEVNGAADLQGR